MPEHKISDTPQYGVATMLVQNARNGRLAQQALRLNPRRLGFSVKRQDPEQILCLVNVLARARVGTILTLLLSGDTTPAFEYRTR